MFWTMPSWLNFLKVWNLLPIVAYVLAFALIESFFVLSALLLLAFLLPGKLLRDKIIPQGSFIIFLLMIDTLLLHTFTKLAYKWSSREVLIYAWLILAAAVISSLVISYYLIHRLTAFERFFTSIAERMNIFLYLYIPLGILGLMVVIIRNIF